MKSFVDLSPAEILKLVLSFLEKSNLPEAFEKHLIANNVQGGDFYQLEEFVEILIDQLE